MVCIAIVQIDWHMCLVDMALPTIIPLRWRLFRVAMMHIGCFVTSIDFVPMDNSDMMLHCYPVDMFPEHMPYMYMQLYLNLPILVDMFDMFVRQFDAGNDPLDRQNMYVIRFDCRNDLVHTPNKLLHHLHFGMYQVDIPVHCSVHPMVDIVLAVSTNNNRCQ